MPDTFEVKDSGERQSFDSGMIRDVETGKMDYTLITDGPMFDRWATHLTKGAEKYAPRNWMQADGAAELERFRRSAFRHFMAWFNGFTDEDHAAGVYFNVNGAEYVKDQLTAEVEPSVFEQDNLYLMDRLVQANEDYEELARENASLSHDLMEARLTAGVERNNHVGTIPEPGADAGW